MQELSTSNSTPYYWGTILDYDADDLMDIIEFNPWMMNLLLDEEIQNCHHMFYRDPSVCGVYCPRCKCCISDLDTQWLTEMEMAAVRYALGEKY